MSTFPTYTAHSNFVSIFNAALETYKRKTKKDLTSDPLLPILQYCESPEAIITVLRERVPAFRQPRNGDDSDRLTKWVTPTVNFLYLFCDAIGSSVGLVNIRVFPREDFSLIFAFQVFPSANAIFAGIGVLLSVSILH